MQDVLDQIRAASQADLFYVALMSALALPDICGALESPDGQANGKRYAQWFDRHVGPFYNEWLKGQDCYYFRCSMLHQGRMQHPSTSFSRIIFIEPTVTGIVVHKCIINDALNIDVRIFVNDLLNATEKWLAAARLTPEYQTNCQLFVSRHANGLPPYIVGVPIIG